jgi:hypothetical protein
MDLTSEFLKEHYLNAYFVDNERTQIAVLYRESNDSDKVVETVIEHNMEHPWCQALFASGMTDLDQLHEQTYQKIKTERKQFEDSVVRIAKKEGLIFDDVLDGSKMGVKSYPLIVNTLFEDNDNEDHLFALKLALFEVPAIKDSKDDEKKKSIKNLHI